MSKKNVLQDRALMFEKARSFFSQRKILEVDTPILSKSAPIDEHIEVMKVELGEHRSGYLHTSPEYAMKRLLALGMGDIYQMGHVFRKNEIGHLHNPEFTMVEWYRIGMAFESLLLETLDFIRLFLGALPFHSISYREVLQKYAGFDYLSAQKDNLLLYLSSKNIELSSSKDSLDKDALLHLIMSYVVEPLLGEKELVVIYDYPSSQAALSRTEIKGEEHVAKRFEVYYKGIELANGYQELTDAGEQKSRFEAANEKRVHHGKESLPIDAFFLQALEKGLPECCGVAVGFDRLMQMRLSVKQISDALPFGWQEV